MVFSLFYTILHQLTVVYSQGDPLRHPQAVLHDKFQKLYNYKTDLDLNVSLDRTHQNLKFYLRRYPHKAIRMTPKTLKQIL